ncbi:unnamed protein product [Rotaria sp. Silwood1]|nr:unnamed protein product [Rotaria sp. Silwood1]
MKAFSSVIWTQAYGGVDEYNAYIVNYVKPWTDKNYRTLSTAKHTVIAGSSDGGLAAFHMALSHSTTFGIAICMSSSFWAEIGFLPASTLTRLLFSLEISDLIQRYDEILKSTDAPILYIDWEQLAASRSNEMVKLLTKKYGYKRMNVESIQHIDENEKILLTCIDPHGEHDEIWWGQRLLIIVNILFDHFWQL